MYKAIFIIVPSCSKSKWLNDKMLQITESFISVLNVENCPVAIVDDYNDIDNFLDKAELLIVSTAGNVIADRDHLWNKIKNFPEDVGIMAHLLQYKEDITPYFHEQFFIINTKAIKKFTIDFDKVTDTGIELIRSTEDLHNGHAPLYITLGNNRVTRHRQFGTTVIEECLNNGYNVRNFDLEWRYPPTTNNYVSLDLPTRGYCYPCKSTDIFVEALQTLKILPGLDPAQEIFINAINKILEFNVLNMMHYETTESTKKYNTVIAPSTGFLGEILAVQSGAKKLILYDKNKNNLDFKIHLYKNWDGNDYENFARTWAEDRGLNIEPASEIDKIKSKPCKKLSEHMIFKNWNSWRNTKIEYIYGDILDNEKIFNLIQPSTLIHTSTILGIYPWTAILHDKTKIKNFKTRLEQKVKETNSSWIKA
jgi:hypothetical protein